jgi:hypothetical protein
MSATPDPVELKGFNAQLIAEFRANGGKAGGPFEGADLLLLTTTGAKSGQRRTSPLAYQRIDGKLLIIGSYRGADIDPACRRTLKSARSPTTSSPANCRPKSTIRSGRRSSPSHPDSATTRRTPAESSRFSS